MVLGEDEVAHSRLQLCDFKHRSGPSPTLNPARTGRGATAAAVSGIYGGNADGVGTEINGGGNFAGG